MKYLFLILCFIPQILWASTNTGSESLHLDGKSLSLIWAIPFVGTLFSIAFFPIFAPKFWHHHYGKISFFWWIVFVVPFVIYKGFSVASFYFLEVYIGEYLPFVVLLVSLYTISGGIQLKGNIRGTTFVNVIMMCIGIVLASWMGTTGAAILMIRPLIKANSYRKYKVHTIIFFIILVANVGGSLTPLGDPPLFLGFLKGVPFFWPIQNMLLPMSMAVGSILIVYVVLDTILVRLDSGYPTTLIPEALSIVGKRNFILLLGVIGAVIISGIFNSDIENPAHWFISYHGIGLLTQGTGLQLFLLLIFSFVSLKITPKQIRKDIKFNWEPIIEVVKLFFTIFFTIVPVIAILKASSEGSLAFLINQMMDGNQPINSAFFWVTAVLSGFLDNAPTYLVFFNLLGGDAQYLISTYPKALLAISMASVFAGALTYIGNAPNFMVRSIAESSGIKMPSFFVYVFYAMLLLFPLFGVLVWVFL